MASQPLPIARIPTCVTLPGTQRLRDWLAALKSTVNSGSCSQNSTPGLGMAPATTETQFTEDDFRQAKACGIIHQFSDGRSTIEFNFHSVLRDLDHFREVLTRYMGTQWCTLQCLEEMGIMEDLLHQDGPAPLLTCFTTPPEELMPHPLLPPRLLSPRALPRLAVTTDETNALADLQRTIPPHQNHTRLSTDELRKIRATLDGSELTDPLASDVMATLGSGETTNIAGGMELVLAIDNSCSMEMKAQAVRWSC